MDRFATGLVVVEQRVQTRDATAERAQGVFELRRGPAQGDLRLNRRAHQQLHEAQRVEVRVELGGVRRREGTVSQHARKRTRAESSARQVLREFWARGVERFSDSSLERGQVLQGELHVAVGFKKSG